MRKQKLKVRDNNFILFFLLNRTLTKLSVGLASTHSGSRGTSEEPNKGRL